MTLTLPANPPSRPVLRYHGGKFRLAKWVIGHFPPHRVYVEPFCGAASVLMQKPRSYAEIINDLDGEIVNVFRVLRDREQAAELERLLRLTPFARVEFDESYEPATDPVERARRTIVRSFMGFGSSATTRASKMGMRRALYDAKTTGFRGNGCRAHGHTPAHDWANYPDALPAFTARLQAVVIECRPALEILRIHDRPDALLYVDPPYVADTRGERRHQYRHELSDADHRELAAALRAARGMVVLSGYPSALYDELFADWRQVTRRAMADGARERTECLWLNAAATAQLQPTLSLEESA